LPIVLNKRPKPIQDRSSGPGPTGLASFFLSV
jgi:hypothetical protein